MGLGGFLDRRFSNGWQQEIFEQRMKKRYQEQSFNALPYSSKFEQGVYDAQNSRLGEPRYADPAYMEGWNSVR